MTAKQPNPRLDLPLICVLTGCVLMALAAVGFYLSPGIIPAGDQRSAQQQPPSEFLGLVSSRSGNTASPAVSAASRQRPVAAYGTLPLAFEANQGQTDPEVKYLARGSGYTLFLTSSEAVLSLASLVPSETESALQRRAAGFAKSGKLMHSPAGSPSVAALRMKMAGANQHPQVTGNEVLPGVSNYFIGNDPRKWRTNVSNYSRVGYQDIYPGVNLAFHGEQRRLEFDFVVAPGADPSPIDLRFTGAKRVATDASGDLVLSSAAGDLHLHKPVAYQEKDGVRQLVDARFVAKGNGQVAFALGAYDATRRLVIDPAVTYATYLGGGDVDQAVAVRTDGSGNAYLTGETKSVDFPKSSNARQPSNGGGFDVLVSKLDPSGATLLYSTYLGGSSDDSGNALAVDQATGDVYVTGGTKSSNFPTTAGVIQASFGAGSQHAFVAKLSTSVGALLYSTFLGGNAVDVGKGIAVDATGNAYVVGETSSSNFPTTASGFMTSPGGADDAFVTELNPTASAPLLYSTYLGGSGLDTATGIALDSSNKVYLVGVTLSTNFPLTPSAFQNKCGTDGTCNSGQDDAFVSKFDPTLSGNASLIYSTYVGGSGTDDANAVAVDSSGVYVTGLTKSSDFPKQNAFQSALKGTQNAFVTKLNPALTGSAQLVYSTYLGGTGPSGDKGTSDAVDSSNNAYVTGQTSSTDFPTASATQTTYGGGLSDAFVTELNSTGNSLTFSTFLGGSQAEDALSGGIAVDSSGNIYVVGDTASNTDFPITLGSFQASYGGGTSDAFLAKIVPSGATASFTLTATAPSPNPVAKGSSATSIITLNPSNGFNSKVALTCSGPSGITCTLSATSVTPSSATSTLTINVSSTASLRPPGTRRDSPLYVLWLPVPGLALVGVVLGSARPTGKKLLGLLLGCLLFAGLVFQLACSGSSGGGGGGGNTPYTVTVAGMGGGQTNNVAVSGSFH